MSEANAGRNIDAMALDGIVNVNSLFTMALFLGISSSGSTAPLVADDAACATPISVAEGLLGFNVYSFSSFLFSSLVAKLALKNVFTLVNHKINTVVLKLVGTLLSAFGSLVGCVLLVMSLVSLVQIKLGTFACASPHTYAAVLPMLILVPSALLIYVVLLFYALLLNPSSSSSSTTATTTTAQT